MATNFKLGRHEAGTGLREHRHANVFERRDDGNGPYLCIGAEDHHCEVMLLLAREVATPYALSYDLLAAREPYPEGRYDLTWPLDLDGLTHFFREHAEFFEHDARHNLRLQGANGSGLLIYDQHDLILASGPIDAFVLRLTEAGLSYGSAELPIPHSHHIRPEFDGHLHRLLASRDWKFTGISSEA
jgi:hypothetical protein